MWCFLLWCNNQTEIMLENPESLKSFHTLKYNQGIIAVHVYHQIYQEPSGYRKQKFTLILQYTEISTIVIITEITQMYRVYNSWMITHVAKKYWKVLQFYTQMYSGFSNSWNNLFYLKKQKNKTGLKNNVTQGSTKFGPSILVFSLVAERLEQLSIPFLASGMPRTLKFQRCCRFETRPWQTWWHTTLTVQHLSLSVAFQMRILHLHLLHLCCTLFQTNRNYWSKRSYLTVHCLPPLN